MEDPVSTLEPRSLPVEQMKLEDVDDAKQEEEQRPLSSSSPPCDNNASSTDPNPSDVTTSTSGDNDEHQKSKEEETDKTEEDVSMTTEDDVDDDGDSSDADFSPKQDPELLLIKANALKEEGNKYFKEQDYEKASRSYRRGTNTLKSLNRGNTGDDQVKALLVTLQTNLSMMCLKLGKPKQSVQVATSALEIDKNNVKALYRRAVAHRQLGDLEQAKTDLKVALQNDPVNVAVKKELASLKKELETAKLAQKKGLQKAFSRSGSLLYDDKEQEKKRKEEEAKQKKKQEEELLKKRKVEWEDECVKRMAKGEPALSFEEWEKERKEKEAQEEKRKKEERRKAREAAKAAAKQEESDSDDELTEKELALLRGYKKTADGRVTSYFTREQSDHEKSLIGDIAPKRLESDCISTPVSSSSISDGGKGNPSVWNQAGTTWEEKNTTDWCRERLEARINETTAKVGGFVASVKGVENMTGEASVAIASGKKRYIFDFHCKVKFEIRDPDTDDIVASGSLKLPDICSTHHHELEVEVGGWKKKPSNDNAKYASECRNTLVKEIRESVKRFVDDFNNMY